MGIVLVCDCMAEIIFVLIIASCRSAPSQLQCSCTIKASTKERSLSLRRRWWNTTGQMWTVGRCAKARRSLRARITSDTATASMKSYQVRNQSRGALSRRRLGSSLPCDLCWASSPALPLFTAPPSYKCKKCPKTNLTNIFLKTLGHFLGQKAVDIQTWGHRSPFMCPAWSQKPWHVCLHQSQSSLSCMFF